MRRLVAGVAVAGIFVVASAAPAWAHAVLQSTNPPNSGEVSRAPAELTLTYDEAVEVSLGAIRLFNCAGGRVDVGAPHHLGGTSREIAVSLPNLARGVYVVSWRVISADSHPVQGGFTFGVGVGTIANAGRCAVSGTTKSSTAVGVLFAIDRIAIFAGLALLIGGATFLVLIARGTTAARRTRMIVWVGWAVTAVSTIFAIMVQAPYVTGSGIGDALRWAVVRDILHTRYGHIAELRLLLLALAVPLLVFEMRSNARQRPSTGWLATGVVIGLGLSATPGLAAHASTGDNTVFAIPIDALHVAATCVWLGGLVALLVSALGGSFTGGLRRALYRFSAVATGCVVVLVLSGLFASWREVGFTTKGYTSTTYGHLLVVKLGIFAGLLALAAISRSIVRRRQVAPLDARDSAVADIDERTVSGLRKSVGGEVLLGIAVLTATALLVNAQPARTALAPALFATEVHAGSGADTMRIDVVVDPAKSGLNTIHIYTLRPDGSNLTIRNISASLSLPSKGITSLPTNLHRGGPNHFLVTGLPITIQGQWKLVIHVLRTEFGDTATVINIPIR